MSAPLITVLVIGPSQNGKSTFINRLISLSTTRVTMAKEGDGGPRCTTNSSIYELTLSLSDWKLVNRLTGQDVDIPDTDEEHKFFKGTWWRKPKVDKFELKLRDPNAPRIRLRLIDTPGLDDSEGEDFKNMWNVLTMLTGLANSGPASEGGINAIAFVYKKGNAFSGSFQEVLHNYEQSMPNIFGSLTVINSDFTMENWAAEWQDMIENHNNPTTVRSMAKLAIGAGPKTPKSARNEVLEERRTEFSKLFDNRIDPMHYLIDSRPSPSKYAFPELISRSTVADILATWANKKAMPIGQIRLIKTQKMIAVDRRMQSFLHAAQTAWDKELQELRRSLEKNVGLRSHFMQIDEEYGDQIKMIEASIKLMDNDTRFELGTHEAGREFSTAVRFFGRVCRIKAEGSLTLESTDIQEWDVDVSNITGAVGKWTKWSKNPSTNSWTGHYEAPPGKSPRLTATSYTYNRVMFREEIEDNRKLLKERRRKKATNLSEMEIHAPDGGEGNEEQDRLVFQINKCKDLREKLNSKNPPIDQGLDMAATARYAKGEEHVTPKDLFDMVRPLYPDLEAALKTFFASKE